jgi:hypothetical protein
VEVVIDVDRALQFTDFVTERHRIWEQRQAGLPQPWTADPILERKKFTSVFRILDPGTQFIMTDLIDPEIGPRDQLMRLFLYRHTGRVEAWEYLALVGSGYPLVDDLFEPREVWSAYRAQGNPLFTNAYLVFPQSTVPGTDKLSSIIDLTSRLFSPSSPQDVVPDFLAASSQAERFAVLRRNKGVADFMSMQILTDWGYTPHAGEDRENEFVVCGPGAVKGAATIDPRSRPLDVHRWVTNALWASGGPTLGDRLPSYMDTQNTLCEFSKYVRWEAKGVTGKPYRAAHPGPQPVPVLPKHW